MMAHHSLFSPFIVLLALGGLASIYLEGANLFFHCFWYDRKTQFDI
jgi:hypothetical protein